MQLTKNIYATYRMICLTLIWRADAKFLVSSTSQHLSTDRKNPDDIERCVFFMDKRASRFSLGKWSSTRNLILITCKANILVLRSLVLSNREGLSRTRALCVCYIFLLGVDPVSTWYSRTSSPRPLLPDS